MLLPVCFYAHVCMCCVNFQGISSEEWNYIEFKADTLEFEY